MYPTARNLATLFIAVVALSLSACAHKYAVLISNANTTADNVAYHSEFWYDLFLEYKTLRENGFKDADIHVVYGNGADFATVHADYNATAQFGHSITELPVNKANIQAVFNALKSKVTSRDYLYVWWMGHGGGSGPGSCNLSMLISTTGEHVTDAELAAYINGIPNYRKRNVSVMTCHSGGIVDNFNSAGNRTVVHASSTCPQSSYSTTATCNGRHHAEFNYTFPNALRQQNPCAGAVPSDADHNGAVSMSEAHQYNQANMTTSTPQLGDPDGLAATTFIKNYKP